MRLSKVDGLTPRYIYFKESGQFKTNNIPVKFFNSIDISNKNYMKYEGKKYQIIIEYGIHGNGKSFSIQHFAERYSIYHNVKCLYIQMREIISKLYSLNFRDKYDYEKKLVNYYDLVCIDEIEKFNITENNDLNFFGILDDLINNMKKVVCGSNMNKDELEKRLGIKIMSRLENECLIMQNREGVLR